MKSYLDDHTYQTMLKLLNCLSEIDQAASDLDLVFMEHDYWLSDTAVIQQKKKRKGGVELYLVFADHLNPFRLIVRRIDWYWNDQKASLHSSIICRMAAKDQRGSLKVNLQKFNWCNN
jgi:hypothetical protein